MSPGAVGTGASLRKSQHFKHHGLSEIPCSLRGRQTAPGTDRKTLWKGIRRQGQYVSLVHPPDHADLAIHTPQAERNFTARGTV